jgi:hypothetical protein
MYIIVKFSRAYLDGSTFTITDRRLLAAFSGLMDLQAMLGFGYLLWSGFLGAGFPNFRILHGLTMFAAAVVAHLSAFWKNADDQTRFLNNFYVLLASFALMLIGISGLPNRFIP